MRSFRAYLVIFFWVVATFVSQATTYYVDCNSANPTPPYATWSTAASTIQEPIDLANSNGGTIMVTNGVYASGGEFNIGSNRVNVAYPNFTIQSVNGPAVTVIEGYQVPVTTNGGNSMRGVFLAGGSMLSGFTVTGGSTRSINAYGGAILCQNASAFVTNCILTGNASVGNGGGIANGVIYNSLITGNVSGGTGGGVYASIVSHCVVSNNSAPLGAGVGFGSIYDSLLTGNGNTNNTSGGAAYSATLDNCTIVNNFSATLGAADGCTLNNSIIYYNSNGLYADCYQCKFNNSCTTIGNGNSFLGAGSFTNPPAFLNLTGGNYHLQTGSPCIDAGLNTLETNNADLDGNPRFVGAAVDLGAYENQNTNTVHYVSLTSTNPIAPYTNWLTAATNLEAAISIAEPGDFVAANAGVYTNDNVVLFGAETNRVAVTNGVTLLGVYGSPATAILGALATRCAYVDSNSIISGFTITNGQASLTGDPTNEQSGGGIFCQPGGLVMNCLVISNSAGNNNNYSTNYIGGGIYGGMISNCTLLDNYAGSGGGAGGGATLWNCLLANNISGNGGGAYRATLYSCTLSNNMIPYSNRSEFGAGASQCSAYNCLITANTNIGNGGGTYLGNNYNCTISGNFSYESGGTYLSTNFNCFITGNMGFYVGGIFNGASYNCVISGNTSTAVDGFAGGASGGMLVNCTVTGNTAYAGGGVDDYVTAYNSIIYFNNGPVSANWYGGTGSTLYNCCTIPMPAGAGNITNDPVFVDAVGGDFQLGCGSPCIDAGVSNAVTFVTTNDIRGMPRPIDGDGNGIAGFDLGAYEFNPATDETPGIRQAYAFNTFAVNYPSSYVAQIGGCPNYYWWDFGDGQMVTNQINVTHTWTSPGTFNIRLQAYFSSQSQTLSITDTVQVVPQPVYYVNAANLSPSAPYTNWAGAASSLQPAIAAGSLPGRLVLVTNGIYYGTQVVGNSNGMLKNGVALTNYVVVQSVNGPLVTMLLPSPSTPNRCSYVGTNSFLSGFTVTNGQAPSLGQIFSSTNYDESGGGIYCEPNGIVSNCIVCGNSAYFNGGGGFQGTYYNCQFRNNKVNDGGGGVAFGTLYNCLLITNRSLNVGGGSANCGLINCALLTNRASFYGGGAYNSTLFNCTVAGNMAANSGGLLGCAATNCIVYANFAGNSVSSNWSTSVFGWSCTAPWPGGDGNLTDDPEFVNPTTYNFHLQPASPAINSGNNNFAFGLTDLDGNPRIMGGTVDMGAYEFQAQVTGTFNSWLQQYALPTDGSANNVDSDGTGMLNWQKWIAGLNPTNPASVLAMIPPTAVNNTTGITITWQSVNDRAYSLLRTSDLTVPFAVIQSNIAGQTGTTSFMDTSAVGSGPFYYQVSVQ